MRFGSWRGVALAFAVSSALMAGLSETARADLFHDIPREVEAVDVHTGGPYFAPPIPYGCYAKDHCGALYKALGLGCGLLHPGLCHNCGGKGCGLCAGDPNHGCGGPGCSGPGSGDPGCGGQGCGLLSGRCHRGAGSCFACGGSGCGFCRGKGLFGNNCGSGQGNCGSGQGGCGGHASTVAASGQGHVIHDPVRPSSQCGAPGCLIAGKHSHGNRHHKGCFNCGGRGCRVCGGTGLAPDDGGSGGSCGSCHGRGCGNCGGSGLCSNGGGPCGGCHGRGCGLCGGTGMCSKGGICGACGGRGCSLCGAGSKLLGLPAGIVNKVLHRGDIKWFVGAGGPVPITPGYVPYVVTTRSPRDFLAFPPFVDTVP